MTMTEFVTIHPVDNVQGYSLIFKTFFTSLKGE